MTKLILLRGEEICYLAAFEMFGRGFTDLTQSTEPIQYINDTLTIHDSHY